MRDRLISVLIETAKYEQDRRGVGGMQAQLTNLLETHLYRNVLAEKLWEA